MFPTVGREPSPLSWVRSHRWLGILRDCSLNFAAVLEQKIACATAAVATLAVLVAGRMIPLALALDLFESKVEGSMRFGLWLLALVDGAEDMLNS